MLGAKGAIRLLCALFYASVLQLSFGQEPVADDLPIVLFGKGHAACDDELPTLKVAEDNIVRTKPEWDDFVKKNNFFVVAAADSTCSQCCDSEPILRELLKSIKDKATLSYPEKNKKQKKIVRKEIKLIRVDLADKPFIEQLAADGIFFPMGTMIYISHNGKYHKYDGMFADINQLVQHMQRVANPLIPLTSEEEIFKFLDNSESTIWNGDLSGTLLAKDYNFNDGGRMNRLAKEMGYNTRVVAFIYDKSEYAEEIKILRTHAQILANRYNLRVGIVTDERLVKMMKKSHEYLFPEFGMSCLVLKRYDGQIIKANLAELDAAAYLWWMTVKTTKAVDELKPASFQMNELANIPMIILFVDFSNPKVAEKSADLIKLMESIAPNFEQRFQFHWTDDENQLENKRTLGVTWDELPAMAVNSLEHIVYAYPREEPFETEKITNWLTRVSMKKSAESELRATDFKVNQRDPTLYETLLEKTIRADRGTFDNVVLREDADSVLFMYSTENVNYSQRKAAFQFNLVVELLSNEAHYKDMVGHKINFYSYDAYEHSYPKGFPHLKTPPQDTTGSMVVSEEQRKAGLPGVYIFPAGQKSMPYTRMMKFPHADDLISFIANSSTTDLKLKPKEFAGVGRRSIDEQNFHKKLEKEGVITFSSAYDEL